MLRKSGEYMTTEAVRSGGKRNQAKMQIARGESRPKGSGPATTIPKQGIRMMSRCTLRETLRYPRKLRSVFAVLITRHMGVVTKRSGRGHLTNWQ